ncbi:MAG: AAA family ATPase, partial [Caldilineaceae bacterium]|nr:AAA family ATPase [Caldilineaceae bacterium]
DGQSPNGVDPSELGPFADVYKEIVRAHAGDGTTAARRVYEAFARQDPSLAQLIAGDPQPTKLVWTVADLLSTEFPDPKWAIPGLLPAGLVVLAGRPKLGKSWLSLQMAVAVGTGGVVLNRKVDAGKVLYLALEDNPRRLQDRLSKQQSIKSAAVDFHFEWPALVEKRGDARGTDLLLTAVNTNGYNLVIIDTISRALGHADQLDQADMNVAFGKLQRMAIERDICLLLVDHHRKSAGGVGDVIDDVMGATSKVGVADAAIGIYRERGQSNATLKVSGRDVDDQELAIQFDRDLFCWQLLGNAAGVKADTIQSDILDTLEELGGSATMARLAKALNKDRSNIRKELVELVNKGLLRRGERKGREVKYSVIDDENDSDSD